MKITLSVIKADIGSNCSHIAPSRQLFETVSEHVQAHGRDLLIDSYVSYTVDDIALLMTHAHGPGHEGVHTLAWDAILAGTAAAKQQGPYGAGQDRLKDAFSGNVRGDGAGGGGAAVRGAAMLPMSELEYTGIMERMAALDERFTLRT